MKKEGPTFPVPQLDVEVDMEDKEAVAARSIREPDRRWRERTPKS